jgi:hypothetical protein
MPYAYGTNSYSRPPLSTLEPLINIIQRRAGKMTHIQSRNIQILLKLPEIGTNKTLSAQNLSSGERKIKTYSDNMMPELNISLARVVPNGLQRRLSDKNNAISVLQYLGTCE